MHLLKIVTGARKMLRAHKINRPRFLSYDQIELQSTGEIINRMTVRVTRDLFVGGKCSPQVFTVKPGDIADRNALGADVFAFAFIAAVAKAFAGLSGSAFSIETMPSKVFLSL